MTDYDHLNPQQREAVTAPNGAVLVLAGPGSGKTRVLTHRIAHLVQQRDIPPYRIVAVTFTNKAAREMTERVRKLIGGRTHGLRIGTFHALCARLLRTEADDDQIPPYNRNYVIYDTDDQKKLVAAAVESLNINLKRFKLTPYRVLNRISDAKNELVGPQSYPRAAYEDEIIARVYERYQQMLRDNNTMDFDDLIMQTVLLFRNNATVREQYQQIFEYVLVDEFQDTNTAQYELVRLWGAPQNNVFVVGDEDQAIYGFRGADYRNVARFRQDYAGAKTILLEQNYRSGQMILDGAHAVISANRDRTPKRLFTDRTDTLKIYAHESYDEREEAEFLVKEVERLRISGRGYSDIAVMYRTNMQSRAIEQAFVDYRVPYQLVGGLAFYQRREVKDMLAYLRLIDSGADRVSFDRIINTPRRGIGAKTQAQFQAWADGTGQSYTDALIALADGVQPDGISKGTTGKLAAFGKLLKRWNALADFDDYAELVDAIITDTNYMTHLHGISRTDEELLERQGNINELKGVLAEHDFETLSDFLTDAALITDVDRTDNTTERVTLMTLHASKGLEYGAVFVTGLEDGILPHSRAIEEGDIEEERRLFYVGMTRAKDKLYLTWTFRRRIGQYAESYEPSRFLYDIPNDVMTGRGMVSTHGSSTSYTSSASVATPSRTSGNEKLIPFPLRTPQFKSGLRVMHAKFGEGMVIEAKVVGDDEEVVVAFAEGGIKRLMASFANLQPLDD